jgi:hypothetical protein
VILDMPGSPRMAAEGRSLAWPWTSVLEQVCEWAIGASTPDDATAAICTALIKNSKRPTPWFIYDLKKTFSYFVEHNYFQIQRALAATKPSMTPFAIHNLNCQDAATIVTTLASLVGALKGNRCRQARRRTDQPDCAMAARQPPASEVRWQRI